MFSLGASPKRILTPVRMLDERDRPTPVLTRRDFLRSSGCAAATALSVGACAGNEKPSEPVRERIVVRALWQQINVGDVAQAPGLLALFHRYLPKTKVTLWPGTWSRELADMLTPAFPAVNVATSDRAVNDALNISQAFVHGSGPSLVAQEQLQDWASSRRGPYGIYGITFADAAPAGTDLLNGASSVFFRDTASLEFAKANGVDGPNVGFAPDSAFAFNLRNDAAAQRFLQRCGLEDGKFMCVIPRLRYTPYWTFTERPYNREQDERNAAMQDADHAPMRAAIIELVRQTDLKVLLCPEDVSQIQLGRQLIFDSLPDDVKDRVVVRDTFWLPDEALSIYQRSVGLFGNEMHSPIICVGNGVPAIVCRSPEQTSKGIMWRDIGLGDWLFELDDPASMAGLVSAVLSVATDRETAQEKVDTAMQFVTSKQQETMSELGRSMNLAV